MKEYTELVFPLFALKHEVPNLVEQCSGKRYLVNCEELLAQRLSFAHKLEVIDDEEAFIEDETKQTYDLFVLLDFILHGCVEVTPFVMSVLQLNVLAKSMQKVRSVNNLPLQLKNLMGFPTFFLFKLRKIWLCLNFCEQAEN